MAKPFFFLCGIIQGSLSKKKINRQSYREKLTRILNKAYPKIEVYDPFKIFPNSLEYSKTKAKKVFMHEMDTAAKKGAILVVYLPRASLGTAIEMWEAYRHGNPVFVITPLGINWAVQCLATRVFRTIKEFNIFIYKNGLTKYLPKK